MSKRLPYHKYPAILKGNQEIARFLGISVSQLYVAEQDPAFPMRRIGTVKLADKLALRQWLGVKAPNLGPAPGPEQIRAAVKQVLAELAGGAR
jgi:hypothetical protein